MPNTSEDDVIRIDGVEYEIGPFDEDDSYERHVMYLRPKRKQTGWRCNWCGPSGCVYMYPRCDRPTGCPRARRHDGGTYRPDWQPFYGKVVE